MKKIAMVCLMLLLAACGGRTAPPAGNSSPSATGDTSALGPEIERIYEGVLPAADGPGIRYRLALRNREYSGDGTYRLATTYLEAENGRDRSFDSEGRWGTLRGSADDPDATVYQLNIGDPADCVNFLYKTDSLVMLDTEFERAPSGLNYTLKLVSSTELQK